MGKGIRLFVDFKPSNTLKILCFGRVFKFSKVQVPLHTVHWYLLVKLTTVSRFSGAMHVLLEVICNGRREAQA